MLVKFSVIFTILFAAVMGMMQSAWATDEKNETLMPKGMWKDPDTGLIWMRCSLGQTWNGNGCSGDPKKYTWWDAIKSTDKLTFAGQSDWRVPTPPELASVMAGKVLQGQTAYLEYNPKYGASNWSSYTDTEKNDYQNNYFYSGIKGYKVAALFKPKEQDWDSYWSASPRTYGSGDAWLVTFYHGFSSDSLKLNSFYVRAVRSGQSLDSEAFLGFSGLANTMVADEAAYRREETVKEEKQRQAEIAKAEEKAAEAKAEATRRAYESRTEAFQRRMCMVRRQVCEASCPPQRYDADWAYNHNQWNCVVNCGSVNCN